MKNVETAETAKINFFKKKTENTQKFIKSNKCKVWNYTGRQWNPKLVKGLTKIINEHKDILVQPQQLFNDNFLNNSETWAVLETAYKNGGGLWDTYQSKYIDENKYPNIEYNIKDDKKTVSLKFYKIIDAETEYCMDKNTNKPKIINGYVKKKLHEKGGYQVIIDFNDENQRHIVQSFKNKENSCMKEECKITGIHIDIIKNRLVNVNGKNENIFEPVNL